MLQHQAASHSPNNAHLAYNYASTNITKTRQVVLAYDGILSMVMRARQAIQENQPEARFVALQKACTVILSLQTSIDHERGGEISKLLDNFYFSVDMRLVRQNMEPDIEKLDRILAEIRMMRDAWADVDAQMVAAGIKDADSTAAAPSVETISSISVSA